MKKIGFIGTGNMGSALARAVKKGENEVLLYDKDLLKSTALAKEIGGVSADLKTVLEKADYVFLGVKPQIMPEALKEIREIESTLQKAPIFISMAVSTSIDKLRALSHKGFRFIRIMPNTPVSLGKGVVLYSINSDITPEIEAEFRDILRCAGLVLRIEEEKMEIGSVISGSGPAFVYLFIDYLAKAGMEYGLKESEALSLAAATTVGAGELLLKSEKTADELVTAVCSPGGTTIEGVKSFREGAFSDEIKKAVNASYQKAKLMSK